MERGLLAEQLKQGSPTADLRIVAEETGEPYYVEVGSTLTGREAGASARAKAKELRRTTPWRSAFARVLRVHTDERAWRVGARGESRVGAELAKLSHDRWYVFNDIPIGQRGANVDHLVIGPAGVFSLNTKNLTGKVWVAERVFMHNGHKTDYLPKAHREADRVSACMTKALGRLVTVRPVLVVMADELIIKAEPRDVAIARRRDIRRWLERQPLTLTSSAAIEIAGKAHLPATWKA